MEHTTFAIESELSVDEYIGLLVRSTLAERRPVGNLEAVAAMLENSDVIATARSHGQLIGVSRALTDFAFCTYLADLAVDQAFQRRGIGKELVRRTHEAAGMQTKLILLAAPASQGYYPHIGMEKHNSCWIINPN